MECLGQAICFGMGRHRRYPARSVDPPLLSGRAGHDTRWGRVDSDRDSPRLVSEWAIGAGRESVQTSLHADPFWRTDLGLRFAAPRGSLCRGSGPWRKSDDAVVEFVQYASSRRKTLDLGTGCGTLALAAASSGQSIIGTDINQRALDFCRINAALNGVSNVSFLRGDRFEPVSGNRF